ncbi:YcaO-like family protein [Micromonosporaceae bacterium Da 78-11]
MRTDLLVNSRTGIVRRLDRRTLPDHLPRSYTIVDSYLSDTTVFSRHPADSAGAGYAFADEPQALAAAVGEAAERYCGNLVPPGLPVAAATEVADAIDPGGVALFGTDQYATRGFPFVALSSELPVAWSAATDLRSGRPAAVPASLVWVNHPGGPVTNPIIQAGLATGTTLAHAHWSGLCEVIERDAMTLAWTGHGGLVAFEPPVAVAALVRAPLHARWYAFPTEVGLPVVGALVRDTTSGYQVMGMGAHRDPRQAMTKALGEALQLVLLSGDYDDPDSGFGRAADGATSPLKRWRPGRDYADAYRQDLADVVDYGCHLQLHLDPVIQQRFEEQVASAVRDGEPGWDPPGDLTELIDRVHATGHQVLGAEVTTGDVLSAGLRVVRVLVPGYYSNSAAGLPFLGGRRLPARLGGRSPRLLPLPH